MVKDGGVNDLARSGTRYRKKLETVWLWTARYRTLLRQWSLVESEMAKTYGVTLNDLFRMSWRRFLILFDSVVEWGDQDGGRELPTTGRGSGEIARTVDWSSASPKDSILDSIKTVSLPVSRSGAEV